MITNGFPSNEIAESPVTGRAIPAETTRQMITGQILVAVASLGLDVRLVADAVNRRRRRRPHRAGDPSTDSAS
jgi:hypothetical protein